MPYPMRERGRAALFGDEGPAHKESVFDPETAERDNDREIDKLAERASLLKRITMDIQGEADRQNTLLEKLQGGMDGARNLLSGTLERFTKVFETSKGAKTMLYLVGGMVLAALAVYFLFL